MNIFTLARDYNAFASRQTPRAPGYEDGVSYLFYKYLFLTLASYLPTYLLMCPWCYPKSTLKCLCE